LAHTRSGRPLCPISHQSERIIGDRAQNLARDLGAALAQKLDALSPPEVVVADCVGSSQAFVAVYDGFEGSEFTAIEEFIKNEIKCFASMRLIRATATHAEYWYKTRGSADELNRKLRALFERMGLLVQIEFTTNELKVTKVTTR
jgi:hypothetical protein